MGYITGQDILDDEYNIFVTGSADGIANHIVQNVNSIYGSGISDLGYGQSSTISAVSAGTEISAAQWATLLNRISSIAAHQGSTLTAINSPSTGDDIAALAALSGNITTIYYNRLNCASVSTATSDTRDRTSQWNQSVTVTSVVTFGSADKLRYFFNAVVRIATLSSRSGGTSSNKNTGWTTLLSDMGTIYLAAPAGALTANIAGELYTGTTKKGGAGTPTILTTSLGAHQMTASNTTIFEQYASSALYTQNYVRVHVKVSGAVLTVTTLFQDDEDEFSNAQPDNSDEFVDGTLSSTVQAIPPGTTNIADSWGTISISSSQIGS